MVEAPFAFFEVKEEAILAHAAQFEEAELGVTPKAFDPVDVIFAAGELILVMMDAVVFVAFEDEAVVGLPAVGVDVRPCKHPPGDDRHQFLLGAVLDHAQIDVFAPLMQANDGDLATRSTASFG